MRDANGLQYFLSDHLGSVVATTDDDGTLTSQQRYLPFGGVRTDLATPEYRISNTDLGYTGQRDLGMGLMDYHARFYSPYLNRFIQPDSLIPDPVNPQVWNRYSYVMNRPVNLNDPSGHMPSEGCGDDGKAKCHASDLEVTLNTQKLVKLQKEADDRKCAKGNSPYCSGWDNWAWDNIPSAIVIHKGVSGQLGFGGEFGLYREFGYAFNWRSFEFDKMYTQGRYAYLGTPQLVGGGFYKGVTFVYGASSNASISGNSMGGGGTASLDSGGTVNATYQQSIGVNEDGQSLIDDRSGRLIQSYQFSLGAGGNLLVNAADAGGLLSEGNTQIGSPANPFENVVYQILRFLP